MKAGIVKVIEGYTRESGVRGNERKLGSVIRQVAKSVAMEEPYVKNCPEFLLTLHQCLLGSFMVYNLLLLGLDTLLQVSEKQHAAEAIGNQAADLFEKILFFRRPDARI